MPDAVADQDLDLYVRIDGDVADGAVAGEPCIGPASDVVERMGAMALMIFIG